MQQTLDSQSWYARSRLGGVLRFYWLKASMIALWLLGISLAAQLISFLMTTVGVSSFTSSGVSASFGKEMLLLLVLGCLFAKGYTTFLLRFGTPRFSVWLGSLLILFACGALFLLCSLLLSIAESYIVLLLGKINADFSIVPSTGVATAGAQITHTLLRALRELPMQLLWTLEWSCMFCLLGCCLRRNKAVTLTVCIVGPLVFWLLLLLPAVREALDVVESGNSNEIIITGMQWFQWANKTGGFVAKNWQWIQGAAALVSLPLSYLCMRGTQQP